MNWQSGTLLTDAISDPFLLLPLSAKQCRYGVLAVIMHAIWVDGTFYCGDPTAHASDVGARAAAKAKKLLGAYA